MGEVYRARDPRLNRDVAIKVLARAGADPARQRRLLDEAQAASALNHPNIITVYDVGTHDGMPFIVSELIEGTSLREIVARAPLAIREVLDLGIQMAEGLAAAHQAGIVHRDFKPENVIVTRDGRVKILDFGLALVGMRDGLADVTVDATVTATFVIAGTVPYMSPEQARGATVDYRADQFALGLTFYEMSTGRRAFTAETSAQILAAILEDDPEPIARLNPRMPAPLRWVIERCMAKDPRQRYDASADLARELRTLRDHLSEFTPATEIAAATSRRRSVAAIAIAALAGMTAGGVLLGWTSGGADTSLARYHFTPIATDAGYQGSPAWSPDGKTLAYIADVDGVLQVFSRSPGSPTRAQITHGRFDCSNPFWSPDGTRLYYISRARDRDGLWSISAAGGEPEFVMENVNHAALSPDNKTLAFMRESATSGNVRLWLSSPPGSAPVAYTRQPFTAEGSYTGGTVHFSPDGSKLGVWVNRLGTEEATEFWVLPMGSAAPHRVPSPAADLVGFSPRFSWLPDSRRVVSALPSPRPGVHLWLMDTEGVAPRLLTATGSFENDPTVSPDGQRLALTLQQADYDVYQLSIDHPSPSAVLATSRNEMDPAWSEPGAAMAFTTDRSGRDEIWLRSQKGDWERPLVTSSDFGASQTYLLSAPAFSPDGQRLAYNRTGPEGARVWITPVVGGPPIQLAPGEFFHQDWPNWSPDGTWIAYVQGLRGDWSLMKMRVGARTAAEVVTTDILPESRVQWAPSGAWIAYNGRGGLSLVSADGKSNRVLHEETWMAFTWSADSQRVYGVRASDDATHLAFTSVDIRSGVERVLGPDFMPLPVSAEPVRGFTRVAPTTFLASIARVRSDVWLLEGFQPSPTLWERVISRISLKR
jgi:serine/threonine protein kinase